MAARMPNARLKRALQPMTVAVRRALSERGLMDAYRARPPYQQNDYLGWIDRAHRQGTKDKRLAQMLDELARGGVYMNMKWSGPLRHAEPGEERHARPATRTASHGQPRAKSGTRASSGKKAPRGVSGASSGKKAPRGVSGASSGKKASRGVSGASGSNKASRAVSRA